jgi:6-phosphogluconate dehydrogenase
MVLATRPAVLGLYHKLLRAAHNYPSDSARQGRTIKESLINKIRKDFSDNKKLTNTTTIKNLMEFAQQELDSINTLVESKYAKQVCISPILSDKCSTFAEKHLFHPN